MRPVSARYLRTIRGSHAIAMRARVITDFQTGVDPTGTEIPVLGGAVLCDATAQVRCTLDLVTDGRDAWPSAQAGDLLPYGNELYVERAVEYGDGVREWVGLGYFRIDTVEQDQAPDGPLRIGGSDRMAGIVDARMPLPVRFTANHTIAQVFEHLVLEVYPSAVIEYDFDPTAIALGRRTSLVERDRYAYLADLAKALDGRVLWWDHAGKLQVRIPPDPQTPVWEVDRGPNGALVQMARSLTRERVYNALVASGDGIDTAKPVRSVAYDNDPASPTYWFGRFGKVPEFYVSSFITSKEQATRTAVNLLGRKIGLPYQVDFSAVPNAALEPHDPVRITYSPEQPAEIHTIESLTIPLVTAAPLRAITRKQTRIILSTDDDEPESEDGT